MSGLFKLSLDDTAFQRVFQSFEDKLNRHEEMIMNLQRLLQQKPGRNELDKIREDLRNEFADKMQQMQSDMFDHIDDRVSKIEKHVNEQLCGLTEVTQLAQRLSLTEEVSNRNQSSISELQNHIQSIATSYGGINGAKPLLNDSLQRVLNGSTNLVVNNFKNIFESINKMKTDLKQCQDDLNKVIEDEANKKLNLEKELFDLSEFDPQPDFTCNWKEMPELPKLNKFEHIVESIEYLYGLVPKLQGYMIAMHNKIVDNADGLQNAMDKDTLDRLFDKLRRAVLEMDQDLAELKQGVGKNLTKKDVLQIINEVLKLDEAEQGTSIGGVKCIACGRDMPAVNGAMTETEANKRMGLPPNSIAFINNMGASTQLFSSLNSLKNGINEAPKAMKSFHACKVSKRPISRPS
ncbi:hypothetical protein TRFO_40165 [Tritrichomonas foetus]|uniref:Uncharacterized protein n=1 Tax=Tritrichomonas foetus TaxID=1144522 RepID=A0A1J4J297_9EUKA|nr:hypothetical protein TRFO_40165 [Tritrichomonas foetus]|eukprot:OHS93576.1 hypothetical protein TRFO_40165 [Tritrichomonas foetus]